MEPSLEPIVADKMGPMGSVAVGRMEPLGPAVGRSGLLEQVVGTKERLLESAVAVDKTGLGLQGPVAGMMVMRKLVAGMTEPLELDVAVGEMEPMVQIVGRMEQLVLAAGTVKLLELVADKKEPNGPAAGETEQVVDRLEERLGLVVGRAKQIANAAGEMDQLLNEFQYSNHHNLSRKRVMDQLLNEFQYSNHHNLSRKRVMVEGELRNRRLIKEARILFQSNNEKICFNFMLYV
jgi:hypothetical protein